MPENRVRVYLGCSLDGCIAGPDHDLSFLHENAPDPTASPGPGLGFEDFLAGIGALLMGRRTYQVLLDHDTWPYGALPVFVATHHPLPEAPGGGDARAVAGPIEQLIATARRAAGSKDVYLDGGQLVRDGLEAGLVDELTLTVLPVILGRGIRLWEGLAKRTNLDFDPPVLHHGRMVQLTARVQPSTG
jgi:dihydrofolate reductase